MKQVKKRIRFEFAPCILFGVAYEFDDHVLLFFIGPVALMLDFS